MRKVYFKRIWRVRIGSLWSVRIGIVVVLLVFIVNITTKYEKEEKRNQGN